MPEYLAPGVYVEEVSSGNRPIEGASTSTAAFIGVTRKGPINQATLITDTSQFYRTFGRPLDIQEQYYLGYMVENFFREGGTRCYIVRVVHYNDILDPTDYVARLATRDFNNQASAAVLTVNAASEGTWGADLRVSIQNSSKFSTTLTTAQPAGSFDHIQVDSTDGITRGSLLWIVNPLFANVTYAGSDLVIDESRGLFRDLSPTPMAAGDPISDSTLIMTPDFRYMANIATWTAGEPLVAGTNPVPQLVNTSGTTSPNEDINHIPLPDGAAVWLVEPDRGVTAVVDRVDGNNVIFRSSVSTTQDFAVNTKVLARDFTLRVSEDDDLIESFENLSTVQTNLRDFADNRVNLGGAASLNIRVAATDNSVPMQNTVARNLTLTSPGGDADGLNTLSANDYVGNPASGTGLYALDDVDDVSIVSIPYPRMNDDGNQLIGDAVDLPLRQIYNAATNYCQMRRYLFCILDSKPGQNSTDTLAFRNTLNASNYAAYYWPWVKITPAGSTQRYIVPPSGAMAGIYAYTDNQRGVHKAPAGTIVGRVKSVSGIERLVSKAEQDGLNNRGVNVIRSFPGSGINVWGARTISSNAEWRYVNVRRLMNFIEKSIDDGTQWVVFEPNVPSLWKNIERNLSAFLRGVWRSGALFGDSEEYAFRVRCNAETNPSETIELGQVITEIAVAVVKPAEFVIFRIRQAAAGSTLEE